MTDTERYKAAAAIFTAAADGKTIQYQGLSNEWWDSNPFRNSPAVCDKPERYRIKPEPKVRPYKPYEVPLGTAVVKKGHTTTRAILTAVSDFTVLVDGSGWKSFIELLEGWEFPEGMPCGVEELL